MFGFNKTFTIERLTPDLDIYGLPIDGKESYQPILGSTQVGALETPSEKWLSGQLTANGGGGGIFTIENPEAVDIIITKIYIYISNNYGDNCDIKVGSADDQYTASDNFSTAIDWKQIGQNAFDLFWQNNGFGDPYQGSHSNPGPNHEGILLLKFLRSANARF